MMIVYWRHWGIHYQHKTEKHVTYEVFARIHNGGPLGWKKPETVAYWNRIASVLAKQTEADVEAYGHDGRNCRFTPRKCALDCRSQDHPVKIEPLAGYLSESLTEAFSENPMKQSQWRAFLRKTGLEFIELPVVVERLAEFLEPVLNDDGSIAVWRNEQKRWDGSHAFMKIKVESAEKCEGQEE